MCATYIGEIPEVEERNIRFEAMIEKFPNLLLDTKP
jgi:hypothetical protein